MCSGVEEKAIMDIRRMRPPARRVVGWLIGLAISIAVMLAGGSVILRNVSRDSRSPAAASLGATLLAIGDIAAAITGVGAWLASRSEGRRGAGP
jgi:hypothetical protein